MVFRPQDYELVDFGQGRKLERFGGWLLDRPSPAAERVRPAAPQLWESAARYERTVGLQGVWTGTRLPDEWIVRHDACALRLRPTPAGHLGVFPEQAANWDWITRQVRRASRPLRVLNLFAYTGGSTLAAAAAGAEVVHVDAAKNIVAWARRNAEASGLKDAAIRWIVDDAIKFVRREVRRGNGYDAVILDPPSYGHGPQGQTWKLESGLLPLLREIRTLTEKHCQFLLLTCHSPGVGPAEAEACLAEAIFGSCSAGAKASNMSLTTASGRKLGAGIVARWPG